MTVHFRLTHQQATRLDVLAQRLVTVAFWAAAVCLLLLALVGIAATIVGR